MISSIPPILRIHPLFLEFFGVDIPFVIRPRMRSRLWALLNEPVLEFSVPITIDNLIIVVEVENFAFLVIFHGFFFHAECIFLANAWRFILGDLNIWGGSLRYLLTNFKFDRIYWIYWMILLFLLTINWHITGSIFLLYIYLLPLTNRLRFFCLNSIFVGNS